MTRNVREENVVSSLDDDFGHYDVGAIVLLCKITQRVGAFPHDFFCIASEEYLSNKLITVVRVKFCCRWEVVWRVESLGQSTVLFSNDPPADTLRVEVSALF